MNTNVLSAVLKRNLVSYFSSPLGYIFIWLFVFLSALAAFFPLAFFNDNLANLDQLNKWLPYIMLVFIPAITMNIWADEVRQGTDELLLTMPATDFDIVIGKYLAAVSIFTVSLLIAMASNYLVLSRLGSPDIGLYLCTHFGYWLLGLAMLAVGMVASFLTRNLTMAYVFGALFNLPLAFMSDIGIAPGMSRNAADAVKQWSFGGQCGEFGRGMLTLSGIAYFLFLAGIMLYLCIILIGRRHWARRDDAGIQATHFGVRCLSLLAIGVAVVYILQNHDIRRDATSERLTALSPYTVSLITGLTDDYKRARAIEPEIAKLEQEQKKVLDAEKKAHDERMAKEKAEAAKAGAKTQAPAAASPKPTEPPKAAEPPKPTSSAKPAEPKSSAERPIARMAGESADDNDSAAPAEQGGAKADGAKVDDKKALKKDMVKTESEKKYETKPALSHEDSLKLNKLKEEWDGLKVHGPVRIDAYVSPEVPEAYVQPKLSLLNVLRQFKILGGDMVELNINEIESFDPMAEVAKDRYNIVPREVMVMENGSYHKVKLFMGVAFTSGLEKVVLPFIDKGLPPEYELVRSLATVTKQKRKRIGVLETDAQVMGGFNGGGMSPKWRLIQELEKQYEVVQVNPAELMAPPKPGEEKHYDVLLAIQPSAMGPREVDSFVAAVRSGIPTVVFEDPFLFSSHLPGTYQPRRPQNNMMMGFNQEAQEKGDIRKLWRLLGIDFANGGDSEDFNPMGGHSPNSGTEQIVWQRYNPYPKFGNQWPQEFVFVDRACGAKTPFNEDDPISSKLQNVVALGPGFIEDTPDAVKRLVAKWYNNQYARQLNREATELDAKSDKLAEESDEAATDKLIDQVVDLQQEYELVLGGGSGKKSIQPGSLDENTKLDQLIAKLLGKGHNRAIADLVTDLKNRFPLPADDDESEESRTVLLTKEAADKLAAESRTFERDSQRLAHEAGVLRAGSDTPNSKAAADRCERASKLKAEAAKLKQAEARMTSEGITVAEKESKEDVSLFKLRIIWTDQAASLKDQAAELLSKPGQSPDVALADEDTADTNVLIAGFKERLANMKTVGDVIKYAEAVVALQLQDRSFAPLIETGPDGGTEPVGRMMRQDMMGGGELDERRLLYYQPSKGQSYVLAAHIQGKPRDRRFGSPINVVLVGDVDAVNDQFFAMREQGKFLEQDIDFNFDNVTFVLNALDSLAGDDRFLEIRKRRAQYRTLARFEEQLRDAHKEWSGAMEDARKDHEKVIRDAIEGMQAVTKKVAKRVKKQHLDSTAAAQLFARESNNLQRKVDEAKAASDRKYDAKLQRIDNELQAKTLAMQATYKLWAVVVPPIPLLLVAAAVFFYRREKEREGVSSKRLR